MPTLALGAEDGLYYEHDAPSDPGKPTFVFVNALTGNTGAWQGRVGPRLRDAGFGTLAYNLRGQVDSPFGPDAAITPDGIVDDLVRLLAEVKPSRPVLCGLSVGGLFAARAILAGARVEGLVLLNTLRRIGPRIAWINDAMPDVVRAGGFPLLLDVIFPLLVNQEFAAANRASFLKGAGYEPMDPAHGHFRLTLAGKDVDWDVPWDRLDLPTLVITGTQDRIFLDMPVVEELVARLPKVDHRIWHECGHLVPQERPDALADALVDFGGKLPEAGGTGA